MKSVLVIVSNASQARIFRVRGGILERLEALSHPESRLPDRELVSDKPGRAFDDRGGGAGPQRSAMDPATDPHEAEMVSFARQVGRRTCIHARRGRFMQLVVFAPPRFLGRLRAALDPAVARRIVASVSNDYTSRSDGEIGELLGELGVPAATVVPA